MSYSEYGLDETKKSKDDDGKPGHWLCLWCDSKVKQGFPLRFSNWVICYKCVLESQYPYAENEKRWVDGADCFKCDKKPIRGFKSHERYVVEQYVCEDCIEWGAGLARGDISIEDFKHNNMAKISDSAKQILEQCMVVGNVVTLPAQTLDRKLYQEVQKHLEGIGGKWKGGKVKGFVFDGCEEGYVRNMLAEQAAGEGRNLKKEFQFFATPIELADRMVMLATKNITVSEFTKILEPSAGDGAIVKRIAVAHKNAKVDCFEINPVNRTKLGKISAARLHKEDFLAAVEEDRALVKNGDLPYGALTDDYDIIIANPPFTGNQDIDHIRAMYECLKVNGRIVTLSSMSWVNGKQKKQAAFREWLKEVDAFQEEVPEGTFSAAGTQVGAMLLVIDKLEATPAAEVAQPPRRECKVCGCHELDACKHPEHGNCWWVEDYLCSHCDLYPGEATRYSWWVEDYLCSHCDLYPGEATRYSKLISEQVPERAFVSPSNFIGDPAPLAKLLMGKKDKPTNNSMKKIITIPATPLLAALKKIKDVIPQKVTMPVLVNVLVKVREKDLQLIATDLDVTIIATIEIDNDHATGYDFLLPFRFLYDIVNLSNGLDITVEVTELKKRTKAVLTTLHDSYNIDELDSAADFPKLPEFPQENCVGIGGDFIEWMNTAATTVGPDAANPAMQKLYICIDLGTLVLASTNGMVIFEKRFECPGAPVAGKDILVSTKVAQALKGFKETSLSWSDNHIAFVAAGITMIGKLQDEKFPKYAPFFNQANASAVTLPLTDLRATMERMHLTNQAATLYLKKEVGTIIVESHDTVYNRKITSKLGVGFEGVCEAIILMPSVVLTLLKQISYVTVTLHITEANRPVVITSESDDSYRALCVPFVNQ